jgi:hypothetical protein
LGKMFALFLSLVFATVSVRASADPGAYDPHAFPSHQTSGIKADYALAAEAGWLACEVFADGTDGADDPALAIPEPDRYADLSAPPAYGHQSTGSAPAPISPTPPATGPPHA